MKRFHVPSEILRIFYRVSHTLPLTITQYDPDNGKMNFWEVHTSVDTAKLIKRKLKCPFNDASGPYQICYGIDGCIFLMNNKCAVFQVIQHCGSVFSFTLSEQCFQIYPSSSKCNQIIGPTNEEHINITSHINWYKGGVIIAGCDGYLRVSARLN